MEATGTVQRRSVRAPQTTTAIAMGSRTRSGTGTAAQVPSRPAMLTRTETQSAQAHGIIAQETPATAAVAPSAIPRLRHSRRTANQSRPMPGVTFVRSTRPQAAGQRNPMTMATASSSEMLPPTSSSAARSTPTANRRGPVRNRTASSSRAVHTPKKTGHGSSVSGAIAWRKAGE